MNKEMIQQARVCRCHRAQRGCRLHVQFLSSFVFVLLCCSTFILQPSSFASDVPAALNYQGVLQDSQGNPVAAGAYRVEFRIWDDPLATGALDLIWGREFPVNVGDGGRFTVVLTDGGDEVIDPTPQTNDLRQAFQGEERHLGLTVTETPAGTVSSPSEIPTRQQLVSAPYAVHSANATYAEKATENFRAENGLVVETGGIEVTGASQVVAALEAGGAATLANSLQVLGPLTGLGTLDLHSLHVHSGGAQFDSGVAAAGNVAVASPATLAGYGTVPVGGIVMWNGATNTIPAGWALCDGRTNNGHVTPNLLNRFLAGAGDAYAVGIAGGSNFITLAEAEIPWHAHGYTTKNSIHAYNGSEHDGDFWQHTQDTGGTTGLSGDNQPHENRPPYYAVYFIMRVQ